MAREKIGSRYVVRIAQSEDRSLRAASYQMRRDVANIVREVIDTYTESPQPLSALLTEHVTTALTNTSTPDKEVVVSLAVIITPEQKDALTRLSVYTGATIQALVRIMIRGYMVELAQGKVPIPRTAPNPHDHDRREDSRRESNGPIVQTCKAVRSFGGKQ